MKTHLYYTFVLITFIFTTFLTSAQVSNKNNGKFVVVLDAGHGGKDPGKHSKYGYKEKDIALKITLMVGEYLEKNPNIKVVYTRKTDVFIELRDRPKIANKAEADLFVSIHCNAHHTEASGTETFVLDVSNTNKNFEVAKAENEVIFLEDNYEEHYGGFNPNSPESLIGIALMQEEHIEQSILLASLIEKNFANKIKRKSRGIKQASLWVIHQTAMPSVLIETGFITNKEEGIYLNSSKGQTDVAKSIYNAIMDYKKTLGYNVGSHVFEEIEPITTDTKVVTPVIEEVPLPKAEEVYDGIVFKVQG
uniref:N-acetylmuramoyl-L-alanine amidase family protein n=1 Tax=Gelidibacter sp. TaxID=2018083 RepID=UPI00404B0FE0